MIRAILNGLQATILKPQSNLFAIIAVVLQTVLLVASFDFLMEFLQNAITGTGLPQATGLDFLIGFIQTYPLELGGVLVLILAFLGIQIGMMVTLGHYAGRLQNDSASRARQSIRFGFGQLSNIVFALLFFLMAGVLGMVLLGIVMELSNVHVLLGMVFLIGFMLLVFYLVLKFFFTFTFWGVQESNLKDGLSNSFSFVSNHWVQTIGLVIFFSVVNGVISMLFYTAVQSSSDMVVVGGAVLINIVLTTFYGLTLGFYVSDQMNEKGGEKAATEKPLRRSRKK